jgi:hypothetical protein
MEVARSLGRSRTGVLEPKPRFDGMLAHESLDCALIFEPTRNVTHKIQQHSYGGAGMSGPMPAPMEDCGHV